MKKQFLTKTDFEKLKQLDADGDMSQEGRLMMNSLERAMALLKLIDSDNCIRKAPWRENIHAFFRDYGEDA
jgi:hypothetical protein